MPVRDMRPPVRSTFRPFLALSLAARGLMRAPGSTVLAVAVLALGISLPATFFSFLVGAIRPLPVPEGDRVVRVDVVQPTRDGRPLAVTAVDLEAMRSAGSLEALGGFRTFDGTLLDVENAAARVSAAVLTPEVLPLLRVSPELGRIPSGPEAEDDILIGHRLWEDLYDADPSVLGRTVELAGRARTLVGVLPEGFGFPFKQNIWVLTDPTPSSGETFEAVGRLADGVGTETATTEVGSRWLRRDPLRDPALVGGVATVRPFTGGRGDGGEAVAFGGLVLIALCLLLIACANVANLLLVRATERVRALGIQAALGAGRAQIGMQLFCESLLVAAVGGAAGLLMAMWAVSLAQRTLSLEHFGYFWMRMAVDGPVVGFTLLLVVGTALAAGIVPVVRVLGVDVQRVLKEESAAAGVGGEGPWSRGFVTVQLALSCGALVAAALTGRTLAASRSFGEELPSEEVLLAAFELPGDLGDEARGSRLDEIEEALASVSGVRDAALAKGAPGYLEGYSAVQSRREEAEAGASTGWNAVTPSFLDVFDIEVKAGRALASSDDAGSEPVAVVSEAFAQRYFPDTPVLGRALRIPAADSTRWFTVVGVVADVPLGTGAGERGDRVLVPLPQVEGSQARAVVRAEGDAAGLAREIRSTFARIDPTLPLWDIRTLADAHAYVIRVPRALASVALVGGLAGLLVAMVGLYGLLTFRLRQRRRELGVRLALGADGVRLARETFAVALRQLVRAVILGLTIAWLVEPVLQAMLLGQDPHAATTYVGVGLGFLVAGMGAALVPALRAGALEPARVLKGD